jgi:hypothetical protein
MLYGEKSGNPGRTRSMREKKFFFSVEMFFKSLKRFGFRAREGGSVTGKLFAPRERLKIESVGNVLVCMCN